MVVALEEIEIVSVVGAGQMGRGIAAVAALAGYEVFLNDVDESQLTEAEEEIEWSYGKAVENDSATAAETEAALDRITFTTELEAAVNDADFVTEAAVEKQSVKEDIFADLDRAAPWDAILATR
ncbi:hypothetical protein BRD19_01355 [Halobacteriales archaeon SW_7_65_23]|nr:MAG: hypothetical protein BRD19_01355 [Halobacteriales archaeon SW_7_65_23]